MKLLQNPIVVGVLAVAAVGIVTWSSLSGKSRRPKIASTPPPAAAAATPAPVPASTPAIATNLIPIDLAYARLRESEWSESPRRDPFGVKFTVERPEGVPPLTAVLNGVWRQKGGFLAVVNQRVVEVGDAVGDYIVHRIEFDRVLFRGPAGIEEVSFKSPPGELPQNQPDVAGSRIRKH